MSEVIGWVLGVVMGFALACVLSGEVDKDRIKAGVMVHDAKVYRVSPLVLP